MLYFVSFVLKFSRWAVFGVYIFRCIGFCLPHLNLVDGCVIILVNRVLGLVVVPEEGSGLFLLSILVMMEKVFCNCRRYFSSKI
jgi:hypothetical protein